MRQGRFYSEIAFCVQLGWSRTGKADPGYFHFTHLALLLVISLDAWDSVRLLFSHRENVNRGKGISDVTNYLAR